MERSRTWQSDGNILRLNELLSNFRNSDENMDLMCLLFSSLGPLVGKVKEYQVEAVVDNLCNNMVRL